MSFLDIFGSEEKPLGSTGIKRRRRRGGQRRSTSTSMGKKPLSIRGTLIKPIKKKKG
jgi:hypothetical protein